MSTAWVEPPAASQIVDEQVFAQIDPPYRGPGIYARRRPQQTVLFRLVQEYLESWLRVRREACLDDDPIPAYVEKAFRAYLSCGILSCGFTRWLCPDCGKHDVIVAFSCRTRGLCPSCGAKYMVKTAAHLVNEVLPRVDYRQWVVSFPRRIRYFLHNDPRLFSAVLGICLRAIEAKVRACSPGAPEQARVGAVVFTQQFGASLNAHLHAHAEVTCGVFALDERGVLTFYQATELTDDAAIEVTQTIRVRVLRHLVRQGCLDRDDAQQMLTWDHQGGFSVDASVHVDAHDRASLERLSRYCGRHPFAKGRLARWDESTVVYRLPKPDIHGRTELVLSPFELLDRLAELIMPPRRHRHRYFGALAPNSPLRPYVVLSAGSGPDLEHELPGPLQPWLPLPPQPELSHKPPPSQSTEDPPRRKRRPSALWALMIARVYEVLPILCPSCGAEMKPVAVIMDPETISSILIHLGEPTEVPRPAPARDPPQADFDFGA